MLTWLIICITIASSGYAGVHDVLKKLDIPYTENTSKNACTQYTIGTFPKEQSLRNHYNERPEQVCDTLVLHHIACSFEKSMNIFTENTPGPRVSPHYIITREEKHKNFPIATYEMHGAGIKSISAKYTTDIRDIAHGQVIQIVPEEKRAWHAGKSYWNGKQGLNDNSIGIENVYGGGIAPFDSEQIKALGTLCNNIVTRYQIDPTHVVGHADIAPQRKDDPSIMFPWDTLYYKYGVGAWLETTDPKAIATAYTPKTRLPQGISVPFVLDGLRHYGYPIKEPGYNTPENQKIIKAFRSHFSGNQNPSQYHGWITRDDMIWIWGLLAKYRGK